MFRKLVSNLPFNPSLIGELSFYYGRMKQEERVRRTGFILVALSIFVQTFAVISPPQSTLAESNNDIIRGGFTTKEQAVNHCENNTQNFASILAYYQIDCANVAASSSTIKTIKTTDFGGNLFSMGRESRGAVNARTGKTTQEYGVSIGGTKYYMRKLASFDSGAYSPYRMLEVKNKQGVSIFIMLDCGNIATVGKYSYTPPPPPPAKPKPQPKPTDECTNIPGDQAPGTSCDVCPLKNGDQYSKAECDVCPVKSGVQEKVSMECDVCPKVEGLQLDYPQCDVCPNIPEVQSSQNECYPCPEAENNNSEEACLVFDKSASNTTQKINDANNTMAQANDTIVYTLSVKNKGKTAIKDFVVEEDLSDVLQYASIVDMHGATTDEDDVLSWPAETIAAGKTITKTITVKINNPIVETPISTSDLTAYDLVLNNTFYGNSVNITLPKPVSKTVETVTHTLPKTGPGETMLMAAIGALFIGYFLARAHLLRKETQLIRTEYAQIGSN